MTIPSGRRPHQDERFFSLFQQLAGKASAAAQRFRRLLDDFGDLEQAVAEIRLFEHEADVFVLELEARLNSARVTPLDREDIHSLTGRLDDIVDLTEATVDRLLLFRITEPSLHLKRLSDTLVRATAEVEESISALTSGSRDRLLHHCHLINEIENEADQILRDALAYLFSGEVEALEVMKWKEIYDFLEGATDACEDVADAIETAALKGT